MRNINQELFNYIMLLADIPENDTLFKYIVKENEMFRTAKTIDESPVKNMEDLRFFTALRLSLQDIYREDQGITSEFTISDEDLRKNGLFKCLKACHSEEKINKSTETGKFENFLYLFISRRARKPKKGVENESEVLATKEPESDLRKMIKKLQADIARKFREKDSGSFFELLKEKECFGIDLGKYDETEDELNVYRLLYLLYTLSELEHKPTPIARVVKDIEENYPQGNINNFLYNLDDRDDFLYSVFFYKA